LDLESGIYGKDDAELTIVGVGLGASSLSRMVVEDSCDGRKLDELSRRREMFGRWVLDYSFGACNVAFGDGVKDGPKDTAGVGIASVKVEYFRLVLRL
jgi:hypothetical protein